MDTVDLQSATADQVARVIGVNKERRRTGGRRTTVRQPPTRQSRACSPYRQGVLDTIVVRSCLAPQPIRAASSSWRWDYPAYDTTVTRDGYALKAPAGVIDTTSGAWLSITPLATPQNLPGAAYPRAAFHISGPWAGPRAPGADPDQVLVTVPAASFASDFDPNETVPYLKHISPDGKRAPSGEVRQPTWRVRNTAW
jgi:hypothetical protein